MQTAIRPIVGESRLESSGDGERSDALSSGTVSGSDSTVSSTQPQSGEEGVVVGTPTTASTSRVSGGDSGAIGRPIGEETYNTSDSTPKFSPLVLVRNTVFTLMNAAVTIFGMGVGVGMILGDSFRRPASEQFAIPSAVPPANDESRGHGPIDEGDTTVPSPSRGSEEQSGISCSSPRRPRRQSPAAAMLPPQ